MEKVSLPQMTISEHVVHDYAATALSLKAHPVSFVREKLQQLHIQTAQSLETISDGEVIKSGRIGIGAAATGNSRWYLFHDDRR